MNFVISHSPVSSSFFLVRIRTNEKQFVHNMNVINVYLTVFAHSTHVLIAVRKDGKNKQ
jgi:hypothetical protein